ncbi:VOC family protein [Halostreptopolyspora alba]|uniref:Glyoxalase n=1 Tax=Halostreptopolyspora alba TaxID=2487137 RepID=A0A3N0E6I1_9ACTN|nr:glyoxalase [Nocardiopsaceae bacterium YIM 96095]
MTPTFAVVGIVTADMSESLNFYRRLGVEIPEGSDSAPHVEAELPGGLRLLWDTVETVRSFDPGWTPPRGGPGVSLGFACDSPAEVDRVYGDLLRAGHKGHKEPWDAFWGQRYAVVLDPDGNSVDLFAPLPASQ